MEFTYDRLLQSRLYRDGTPHYWMPQPMKSDPHCLFGDEDLLVKPEWGVDGAIEKLIALGLFLELPVGQWVYRSRRLQEALPIVAKKLLHTNIKDEHAHDKGFRYASQAYPVSEANMREAEHIAAHWMDSDGHLLERAAIAETGVFLVSLGFMRLTGGSSLANMAQQISQDEFRHVATNRGVLFDLGFDPTNPNKSLRDCVNETLDWVFQGVSVPGDDLGEDFDFNLDFAIESGISLIETGEAKQLDSLMSYGFWSAPFEVSNASQYARAPYKSLCAVA